MVRGLQPTHTGMTGFLHLNFFRAAPHEGDCARARETFQTPTHISKTTRDLGS